MADSKGSKPSSDDKPVSTNDSGIKASDLGAAGSSSDATADRKGDDTELLSAAASSSDAAVHQLLGEREIAARNGDEDALKGIDDRLREALGK